MEKLTGFAEGKYEIHVSGAQIAEDYEQKRTDAWERIEGMGITKRIVSTQKMLQASRQNSTGTYGSLGRSNTTASTSTTSSGGLRAPPPMRSTSGSSFVKKAPPPPPSFGSQSQTFAAPPPYSAGGASSGAAAAAAAKRAPPPPPPLKPKPKSIQYVVALYDFAAQVRFFSCVCCIVTQSYDSNRLMATWSSMLVIASKLLNVPTVKMTGGLDG